MSAVWVLGLFLSAATISSIIGRHVIVPVRTFVFPYSSYLPYPNTQQAFFLSLLAGLRGGITIGGIAAAIKLMKYWYVKEQRNLQLQKENVESQLQLLKAQVHPHFLFNTLNNIYSFTQNTSPVASELVSRLSDMLRFILYEANHALVPLSKEIKLVEDYINLEKVRYGNMLDVHIDTPRNTSDLHIAPLLLLPLVENCFKHGTSQILEHPWISLQIRLHGREMHMKLMNGKTDLPEDKKHAHGIGIQNVVKRLSLIYPGRHEFFVTSDEDVYIVNMKIVLEQKSDTSLKTIPVLETAHA
jgi:LytS/YehU family sensor histidine kinase